MASSDSTTHTTGAAAAAARVNVLGDTACPRPPCPRRWTRIRTWTRTRERTYVCVTGVHGIMECGQSALRKIHNSARDGHAGRHAARVSSPGRAPGDDARLWPRPNGGGVRGFRRGRLHAFPLWRDGRDPRAAGRRLTARFPGLRIVGWYSPPFRADPGRRATIAATINDCAPDLVWVGLSTPKQEPWMADFRPPWTPRCCSVSERRSISMPAR